MPEISSGDLALLRGENHRTNFYLTPCPATALWSARLNGTLDRGATAVTFDGGTGANFAAIGAFQELWIGSAAGKNDVGRIRIRSITSADSGVTGTVTIAANSIVTSDNNYLTFIGWYILKPIRPLIGEDGTFYKDTNITYSDQNSEPNPVCIAGENRAGFIDATAGYFEIESQLPSSYVMASGATISSYAASLVWGADTPTISINSGTGVGYIRFDTPGVYWIKWSVTDSNSKVQDTYRWYYAHSPLASNAHYPIVDFSVNNLSGDYEAGGWSCGIQLHDDATLADIPDYAPCILWSENWYGSTKKNITYLPDESGTILNGYVRRDQFNSDLETGSHTASFELTTIQGVNENKYNFSVSLEAAQTVDTWWKYPSWLTPTRAVHHFFKWHSNLLEIADVIGLNSNTDGIAYAEFQDGTLLGMPNSFLRDRSIRASLVCDIGGRVHLVEDVQLRPDSERAALGTVQEITNADKSGEIVFVREQENRTPFVHTSGFSFGGTFDGDGKPEATAICAIAPGDNPLEDGQSPISYGRQTFTSQTHANQIAGRVLNVENNKLPEIRVNFSGNYLGTLGIHLSEFWELTIASGDTVREIAETHNLILKNVVGTLSVEQGTIVLIATYEAEATGQTGIATSCPEFPDLPGDDFTIPEIDDLAGALVTAASVNYLPPQTKAWTVRTAEATQHLYADPFWTTRQESFASIDAILLRCGVGFIKRSVDGGQNWTNITPATDPPNSGSDTPAPTKTTVTYIQGEGSYITESEHVFIARWQNTSDEWRSWIAYTDDDGANWTWKALSGGGVDLDITSMDAETTLNQPYTSSAIQIDANHIGLLLTTIGTALTTRIIIINTETGVVTGGIAVPQTGGSTLHAICRLQENRIAVVWFDSDSFSVNTAVYEIVDGVEDSASTVENLISITSTAPTAVSIARVSDTAYVVACNRTGSTNKGVLIACEYDEVDTVTSGSETEFFSSAVDYLSMIRAGTGVHLYYKDTTLTRIAGVSFTVSSLVITQSSHYQVTSYLPNQISAINLSGDKDLIVFSNDDDNDKGYAVVVTMTGAAITFANIGSKIKDSTIAAIYPAYVSETSAYCAFQVGTTLTYKLLEISGYTVTAGSEVNYPSGAAGYPLIFNSTIGLVLAWRNDAVTPKFEVLSSGPGALKVLGASISKGLGDTLYLTAWNDNGELIYQVRAMSDLSLTGAYSLGACTEEELTAKTYFAMPYAVFGDDAFFYLYGRFAPSSVGLSQIIYSADSGVTLTVLEASWGSAYCGSLIDDFGLVFAARCAGAQAKLYTGQWDSSLELKSTMLFSAAINPFSMVYNFYDDSLYAAAAAGGSIMVIKANSPFTAWSDITYDHSTAAGINAIVAL